jgi:hypothetical protein
VPLDTVPLDTVPLDTVPLDRSFSHPQMTAKHDESHP